MSEGAINIRCPFCGYPYPMTQLQLDVYKGRSMGCMGCGKSFPLVPPSPPRPDPLPPPNPAVSDHGTAPADRRVGAGGLGPGEDTAAASYGPRPADPSPRVARLGVAAAVLFVALAAAAAVVGYAGASDDAIRTAAQTRAPMWLLRAAVVSAAVAAALGLTGVWVVRRQTPDPVRRRVQSGPALAALGLGGFELLLATLLGVLALPPLARGLAVGHQATCKTHLQQLAAALLARATARPDGMFPDALANLVRDGQAGPEVLVCPAHADREPAPAGRTAGEQADLIAGGQHVTYTYLGKGWSTRPGNGGRRASTHTVIAHEPPGLHGDPAGFHLLFADGVVVYAEKGQAAKLLGELQAGQNPPPTAHVVRP